MILHLILLGLCACHASPTIDPVDLPSTDPVNPPSTDLVDPPPTDPVDPPSTDPVDPPSTYPVDPSSTEPIEKPTTQPDVPHVITAPPYWSARNKISYAVDIVHQNVLSMQNDTGLLNDSRRHFAEIVFVVTNLAKTNSACVKENYLKSYQSFIDAFAPLAIERPELAIDAILEVFDEFSQKTHLLELVINDICIDKVQPLGCDYQVDKMVKEVGPYLKNQSDIYLAGYDATQEFINLVDEFLTVSEDYSAHKFIIEGVHKLENLVRKLTRMLLLLEGLVWAC